MVSPVNWRTAARLVAGALLVLLGLLWMLQGADVVSIRPVLCAGDCQPVTGGSTGWLIAGVITVPAGLGVAGALPRRRPRRALRDGRDTETG